MDRMAVSQRLKELSAIAARTDAEVANMRVSDADAMAALERFTADSLAATKAILAEFKISATF